MPNNICMYVFENMFYSCVYEEKCTLIFKPLPMALPYYFSCSNGNHYDCCSDTFGCCCIIDAMYLWNIYVDPSSNDLNYFTDLECGT